MPSDYEQIRKDNIREYGEGTRHLSFLGRLYTDRTHFIFELLQNAEDAGASRILFHLFKDRLEVAHDGRLFDERDVRGVCGVGEGTKAEDLTQIGKFGIGFKSVYAYTAAPEVHSGDEHFCVEHYVRPRLAAAKLLDDGWTTLFVFVFDAPSLDPEAAFVEISTRLRNLEARTLLFLREIKEIEYKLPDETGGVYLRDEILRGPARRVTVIGQNNGEDESEDWLVFERYLEVPDSLVGSRNRVPVEVGFLLETDARDQSEFIARIKDSALVVSFPTEKETHFGFLVQGPYRTTPSRDNIPKDDDWNANLVKETAILLTEALPYLKETGLLTVALLEALPIRMDDFPKDGMFYPVVVAVRDALMNEALLPTDDGTFVCAQNAKLARGADLRTLLDRDQLHSLFQSTEMLKWLAGEITQDRTPDLRAYLLNELHIEEMVADGFARKITESFLSTQNDDWFVAFYEYLSGQEALWRLPRWSGDAGGPLRIKPILRLQDDRLTVPFRPDGATPNAFLPPSDETDFPIVKRSIANNRKAQYFLKRLGLSEPDIFDDIVRRVLPKYIKSDVSLIAPNEHASDIQKILRALKTDSEAGKRKVTQAAKQTPFLRAIDRNGGTAFRKPAEVYLLTEELTDYFFGNPGIWFLDESEGEEEWRKLGVVSRPRFKKIAIDLPWDERSRLRGNPGHTRDIETADYEFDGLNNFLSRVSEEKASFDKYSLILWNFLLGHLRESPQYRFYEGEYKWFYYQERSATFDATWKKQLRSNSWLPKNGDNVPHLPSDLRKTDLPDSFERDERLVALLGMKRDVVAILAESAGIKFEDIELMRRHPEEFQRWKATIVARNEKPIFPTRTVGDDERRREKIVEQITEAPEKKYEERERSVRTTRGSVAPDLWLRNHYTNKDGLMVCQICKEEMPFRKRDGEYYFEAVEALSKDFFPKEHEAQFLALCPLCAAMYKEFVKQDDGAMKTLRDSLMSSDKPELSLQLGEQSRTVEFVESHFFDIRTILGEIGDGIE
jgi:hypothetical protein